MSTDLALAFAVVTLASGIVAFAGASFALRRSARPTATGQASNSPRDPRKEPAR